MNEEMEGRSSERMGKDEWIKMVEHTNGRTDRRKEGRMNERMNTWSH